MVRQPGEVQDEELAPGRYDAIILGDVPATFLTPIQQQLIYQSVERGGGLLMLLSVGAASPPGGRAGTPIADLLPVKIHPGDDQYEPKDGIKVAPNRLGLENYVTKLAADRVETARIWATLPPIPAPTRFSGLKENAIVLATSCAARQRALDGRGRLRQRACACLRRARPGPGLAFPTRRDAAAPTTLAPGDPLAHPAKEEQEGSQVLLSLDRRRVALWRQAGDRHSASDT